MSDFFDSESSFIKNAGQTWSKTEPAAGTMRFEVRGDDYYDSPDIPDESDDFAQGKNRSEIGSFKSMQWGRAFEVAFDFFLEPGAPNSADWLLLAQFHQTEDKDAEGNLIDGAASPPLAIQMRGERMEVVGRTDPNPVTTITPPNITQPGYDTPQTNTMYIDDFNSPLERGRWYSIQIEVTFDYQPGGSGSLRVLRDGVELVNYRGPLGYNDAVGPYMQMGVYREQADETFAAQYRNLTVTAEGTPPPMTGTAGDDDINANTLGFWESEVLNGLAGDDTLDGGRGADTMNGGSGNDFYVVDNAGDVVNERNAAGNDEGGVDQVRSYINYTLGADIENLILWADADIDGTGNALANTIQGNTGDNTLRGLGGNDSILGDLGNDVLEGGDGDDQVYGGGGNDTVRGDAGNDELYGEEGDDLLEGGAGNDTLEGDGGTDTMVGGLGDDEYVVEQTTDVVREEANGGTDTVRAAVDFDAGAGNHIEVINTVNQTDTTNITLAGTDGDNEIRGNAGNNTLIGRGGNDLIQGFDGDDRIEAGAGDDTVFGDGGNDTMLGGAGNDQFRILQTGDVVIELAGEGDDTVRVQVDYDAGADNHVEFISTIDQDLTLAIDIFATDGDNEVRGNQGANELRGRGGNDLMQGYRGADTLYGDAGADTIFGGEDNDLIEGGDGDDSIQGEAGADTVRGDAGNDTIFTGTGADNVDGGTGDDSIHGEDGNDTILGGAGADTIFGDLGNDSIRGGADADVIQGNDGDDSIFGEAGEDQLFGGAGRDSLDGGADNDILRGEDGVDTLVGGAGDDMLYSGTSDDPNNGGTMRGGLGDDTYFVDAQNSTITELAGEGNDTVRTTVSLELAATSEIEVLRVAEQSSTTNLNLRGSDSNNEIRGNDGSNVIRGGQGQDTMFGFGGDDTFYVDNTGDIVVEADGGGTDRILTTVSFTLGSTVFVETLEVLNPAAVQNVNLSGNQIDNRIVAGAGDDSLIGGDGDDTLEGGDGDDTIVGGAGTDSAVMGVASTEVTSSAGATSMNVQSLTGLDVIRDDVEFLIFTDRTLTYDQARTLVSTIPLPSDIAGDDSIRGTSGNDTIYGGGGNDTLEGLAGNDVLRGGSGTDTLSGGDGNDSLYTGVSAATNEGGVLTGGAGNDTYFIDALNAVINEIAGQGDDSVRTSVSFSLAADDDIEYMQVNDLNSTDDIDLGGSNIANTLRGNAGNNLIDGGAGIDTMFGGDGDDTFHVDQAGDDVREFQGGGTDTILTSINLTLGSAQYVEILRARDESSTNGLLLTGNGFDNLIAGTDGDDSLNGGDGNDTLIAHDGNDTIVGGDGVDQLVLDIASTEASATAGPTSLLLQTIAGDKFVSDSVEQIVFTDITLTYQEASTLVAAASVNIPGDLTRDNTLTGTAGADAINGGLGDDSIRGLGGNDTLRGDEGADTLDGGAGNDVLFSGSSDNPANGGTMIGGAGNDLLYVDAPNMTIVEAAGGGSDTVSASVDVTLAPDAEIEEIRASDGNALDPLSFVGSNSANSLRGNAGNNELRGGGGNDTLRGFGGDDIYHVESASDQVIETDGFGYDTLFTAVNFRLTDSQSIEVLAAEDPASTAGLTLQGNGSANRIVGNAGNDWLLGHDGDDTLEGGAGDDTFDGGDGVDDVVFDMASTEVTATRGGTTMTILSLTGLDILLNTVENLVFTDRTLTFDQAAGLVAEIEIPGDLTRDNVLTGTPGGDDIDGRLGNDRIDGLAGNDVLRGSEGVDTLIGGAGNDTLFSGTSTNRADGGTMIGGSGDDSYYVEAPNMTVTEAAGGGNDVVRTLFSVRLAPDSEVETLRVQDQASTNVIELLGSDSDNELRGNDGRNVLNGAGGNDTMYGFLGDDVYFVDTTGDRVIEGDNAGIDTIYTSINLTLSSVQFIEILEASDAATTVGMTLVGNQLNNTILGTAGDDSLVGGSGNDSITGRGGDDTLVGGDGDDELLGSNDNDFLTGGEGNDTLIGGAGSDTNYGGAGTDRIVYLTVASNEVTARVGATSMILETPTGEDFVSNDIEEFVFTDATLTYAEVSALVATPVGVNPVNGTDAAENVRGTEGNDLINAGGGGDWITPGTGSDTIDGGEGRDMVSFVDLPDTPGRTNVQYRLDLDLTAGTATTSGQDVYELLNVERITATIYADRIKGSAGDDQLRGLGDYDWFVATTGNDTYDGGTGQDMISYVDWQNDAPNTVGDPFESDGVPPVGANVTGVLVDLSNPANNTNLAAGHTYVDMERITGSGRQDVFFGDEGENDFRGLGDYDWFVSSTGGRERYFGGDGIDTVTYFNASAGVTASLRNGALVNGQETGRGTAGDAALDLYFEIENLVGTQFNDNLTGNSGRNQLNGLAGDDFLFGFAGIDQLKGGAGNDVIDGGGGSDYALYDGNRADYTLTKTASNTVTISGAEGIDSLIDVEYFRFADGDVSIWELA